MHISTCYRPTLYTTDGLHMSSE